MTATLSKSKYQSGLQCRRSVWLECNNRRAKSKPDARQQGLFDRGHRVGELAWGLFPGGTLIANGKGYFDAPAAVSETLSAMRAGDRVIYEAAFIRDNATAFVDIMVLGGDGRWDFYEVKSSSSLKDVHRTDAGVQGYILAGSGIPVGRAFVVTLSGSESQAQSDPHAAFELHDVTGYVSGYSSEAAANLREFNGLIGGSEPDIGPGRQCDDPYECGFKEHCSSCG